MMIVVLLIHAVASALQGGSVQIVLARLMRFEMNAFKALQIISDAKIRNHSAAEASNPLLISDDEIGTMGGDHGANEGGGAKNSPLSAFSPKRPAVKLLAVRWVDVLKNSFNPDVALQLELKRGEIYLVPLGPKLVSVLIESSGRARRALPAPKSPQ